MRAPTPKSECVAISARQIENTSSTAPGVSESFNGKPLGGAHHCIGTGYEIVNEVFRYLRAKGAPFGGNLTDSELAEAQIEFVEDFQFMFGQFEGIHARCMEASCTVAPALFAKSHMLSSLLFVVSRNAAAHAFSNEVLDLRGTWLNAFYVALSDFVRQYICLDAEMRLTNAYVKASCEHGQSLTINRFLQEQVVQNVLRECLRGFATPGFSETLLTILNDTLDDSISTDAGIGMPHLHKIAIGQMREFLNRLPDEIRIALKQSAPIEMAR